MASPCVSPHMIISSLRCSAHAPPRPCAPVAFREKSRNQRAWNSFLTWPHLCRLIITWADNSIPQSIAYLLLLPNSVSRRSSLDSRRLLPTPPPTIVLRQPLTSLGPDRKQLTPPTVITVMAIRESVTSSPRCDSIWPNPPCSTPTFWPGRWGSWVGWRWDTGRGVGVCDLTD